MKWEKLKKYLLETHEEYQDRNGLPYCKNCGVSMKELVNDVEVIIASEREKAYERGFLEGKNEWGKKFMATEISFEEAVDKHIKQAVEEYKRDILSRLFIIREGGKWVFGLMHEGIGTAGEGKTPSNAVENFRQKFLQSPEEKV